MPTESLRVQGQFFSLKTNLSFLPSKGFKPLSKEIIRSIGVNTRDYDESGLDEVCNIIKKEVVVLDLNFNSWNLITPRSFKAKNIDIDKITAKKCSKESLLSSLKTNPVIPTTKTDLKIAYEILDQYLAKTKLNLSDNKKADIFVLSGEMVWSEWLTDNMIAYILSAVSPNEISWHIDNFGIWQSLIAQPLKNTNAGKINRKALEPNLYYYMPSKAEKAVNLDKDGDKRTIVVDGKCRFIKGIKDYVLKDTYLPENLVVGGRTMNMTVVLPSSSFVKSVFVSNKINKSEVVIPDKELVIKDGIGFYEQKSYKLVKLFDYSKKIKLLVSHGQKVEENEVIAQNLSLGGKILSENFLSPINGYIDLSKMEEGLMLIWSKSDKKTSIDLEKIGKYKGGQEGKQYKFESESVSIPLELVLGDPVSGIIVQAIDKGFEGLPKILMLNHAQLKDYKTEDLLNKHVTGLLFDHLDYSQINAILKNRYELFSFFTISSIDAFVQETNPIFVREINNRAGAMGIIHEKSLQIIDNISQERLKKYEERYVKYISYNSKFRYYKEARRVGPNKVLISNGKEVVESDICNLIYFIDGSDK